MYDVRSFINLPESFQAANFDSRSHVAALHWARELFNRSVSASRLTRIVDWLRRRPTRLDDLYDLAPRLELRSRSHAGCRPVAIRQIVGTGGRINDFDRRFHPLNERVRERWLSIALARFNMQPLPPVELVQIGQRYFVTDGHHRISVARALGEETIDAEVTVWSCCAAAAEPQPAPAERSSQRRAGELARI